MEDSAPRELKGADQKMGMGGGAWEWVSTVRSCASQSAQDWPGDVSPVAHDRAHTPSQSNLLLIFAPSRTGKGTGRIQGHRQLTLTLDRLSLGKLGARLHLSQASTCAAGIRKDGCERCSFRHCGVNQPLFSRNGNHFKDPHTSAIECSITASRISLYHYCFCALTCLAANCCGKERIHTSFLQAWHTISWRYPFILLSTRVARTFEDRTFFRLRRPTFLIVLAQGLQLLYSVTGRRVQIRRRAPDGDCALTL